MYVCLLTTQLLINTTVSSKEGCVTLQKDLKTLEVWEQKWDMRFNPGQVLHITRSKKPIKHPYSLHGQTLQAVSDDKYLGVTLSSDMSWTEHIKNVSNKANKTLGFILRNIKTKNQKVREMAYKTLVRPQLEYASPVWSPGTLTASLKIEATQRRAARSVKNNYSPYDSVTDMQKELDWRALEDRRTDARLIPFYKIVHGLV